MKIIRTKTFYLEMLRPHTFDVQPPLGGIEVIKQSRPSVEYYRFLYRSVGEDFQWVDRLVLADDSLRRIIHDDMVDIYVLKLDGRDAGYAELDRRCSGEIELAYFGLFPPFVGRGLGRYFLDWTLRTAWSHEPDRVWVHTCDLDHQAALPNYLNAGFEIYDEKMIDQHVPDLKSGP